MAFLRYAAALVVKPEISERGWSKRRKVAKVNARNLVAQASEILGEPFNPERYLLTHSTIVASVDVDAVPNVKLGRIKVGSTTINRKYGDYYVQPQCSQFVNNNGDCWSRSVLLASYPTFIGAHNFQEHVQIEEQSRGRIIDAVARDIGDSVYVDILVATDRRHNILVNDILSGKMATLSMGCSVDETICTKCGNVAVDETDLCNCIKYAKLNKFLDERGQQRVIAELCGHPDLDPHAGVHFIEASWVATPAFTGAVLRNILEPSGLPESMARRVQAVLGTVPPEWSDAGSKRVASGRVGQFDFGDEDESEDTEGGDEDKTPLQELKDKVIDAVTEQAQEEIEDELRKQDVSEALAPDASTAPNDSIIKEGYRGAVHALMRTASSDVAFVDGLASLNHAFGIRISRDVYRAALMVGSRSMYPSTSRFLKACQHALGRPITPADVRVMVRIGGMLSRVEGEPVARSKETIP